MRSVIYQLLEIISRGGCMLLNVPLKPEDSLDPEGDTLLDKLALWMETCGDGEHRMPNGNLTNPEVAYFDSRDFRFTRKDNAVYAFCMKPEVGETLIRAFKDFSSGDTDWGRRVVRVDLLGGARNLPFTQDGEGLHIAAPDKYPVAYGACFKVIFET